MTTWTDVRTDKLKKLWADGCTAGAIARELGEVTRNAVIGKVYRLGLRDHGKAAVSLRLAAEMAQTLSEFPRPAAPRHKSRSFLFKKQSKNDHANGHVDLPATELCDLPMEKPTHGVTLLELDGAHCRWPLGEPGNPDFRFCGGNALTGFPYCAPHTRMAHVPVRRR
jgi:GcrA cell cycle regulator